MLDQLLNYLEGNCSYIGPGQSAIDDMHRVADRGGEHLGGEGVIVVNLNDIANELHSVSSDIMQASDNWRDVFCTVLRRKQSLCGGKSKRDVHAGSFTRQNSTGFQSVKRQRTFDDNIGRDLGVFAAFF